PDRKRALADWADQSFGDGAAARLEDPDPDRRRERAGEVRKIAQRYRQLGLTVVVGRRRLDVAAVPGELFADETELEVGIVRERVVVEGKHRLGLDPQAGSRRTIVVTRRDLDREGLARADQLPGSSQLDLQLRRDEILDPERGGTDRRRLWIEAQFDTPRADPCVAGERKALMMRTQLVSRELPALDL